MRTAKRYFSQSSLFRQRRRRGGGGGCSSDAPNAIQGEAPQYFPTLNFGGTVTAMPGEEGGGTMRTMPYSHQEYFYFHKNSVGFSSGVGEDDGERRRGGVKRAQLFCRLCQEEVVAPLNARSHIVGSSRASHLNHSVREIVLDSLTLLLSRGYPVDDMPRVWARVLANNDNFPRIHSLCDPDKPLRDRAEQLIRNLQLLRDMGVIDISLAIIPWTETGTLTEEQTRYWARRRASMERTECIGDNSWGNQSSWRMIALFPDRQFLHSQFSFSYNCFRDACEMNLTLEWIFDLLHIPSLFPVGIQSKLGTGKVKADVVEAIIGELNMHIWGYAPEIYDNVPYVEVNGGGERSVLSIIEHVLTEINDLIFLHFLEELSHTAVPLAKELAAPMIWGTARGQFQPTKHHGNKRKQRQILGVRQTFHLPAPLALHQTRQVFPRSVPNPLRAPGVVNAHTITEDKRDVFVAFAKAFQQSNLLSDDLEASNVRVTVDAGKVRWHDVVAPLKLGLPGDPPLLDLDLEEIYFRDRVLDISATKSSLSQNLPPQSSSVAAALQLIHPKLRDSPEEQRTDLDAHKAGYRSLEYAKSTLVPAHVKPPVAGVITDKNLHFGAFFLSLPQVALPKCDKSDSQQEGKSSPRLWFTLAEGNIDSTVGEKVTDGSEKMVSSLDICVEQWKRRWSGENKYFPVVAMLPREVVPNVDEVEPALAEGDGDGAEIGE